MNIEVIITYWGDFKIPQVVLDAWNNQTDKDFRLSIIELGYPLYRNLGSLDAVKKSKADIIFISDGDVIYKKDAIERIKKIDIKDDCLYYFNRLMLNEETSKSLVEQTIKPEDIVPINNVNDKNNEFIDREDNNFPNNAGAFGYCQIGSKKLFEKIMPKLPILGFHVYDSLIQNSATNIMIEDSFCYHLSGKVFNLNKPIQMKLNDLDRHDFGLLFNHHKLTGVGLELGVQKGVFAEQIAKKWKGQHLFLVDIWEHQEQGYDDIGNVSTEEHLNNMLETIKRTSVYGDTSSVSVMRMRSIVASQVFRDNLLDWIYIDANHDYMNVKLDISYWYNKVKSGGIIAGDDWDMPDVRTAVFHTIMALNSDTPLIVTTVGNRSWYFVKP